MVLAVERLIKCIQSRSAMWDADNPKYHNREIIMKLWKEVATECGTTIDTCKWKWKNLRRHFRSEHNKSAVKESTWEFYNSLLFLKDKGRRTYLSQAENQEEIEFDMDDAEDEGRCDGTNFIDVASGITNTIIKKESLEDSTDSELLNVERKDTNQHESPISMDTRKETYDDIDYFLKSLHRPMSQLPLTRQMYLRVRIQELIHNEIENQSQSQNSQPTYTNPPSNSSNYSNTL